MKPARLPGVDALKAVACVLIVWHHLAFYGPMSDVVHAAWPAPIAWLYDYGRMAVQVFLVVGGYLAAASLAPDGQAKFRQPLRLVWRRYRRLAVPLVVAVAASVAVAALVRPWFPHESVPAGPGLWQLVAHGLLLQDLVGEEALSAGLWYVAIDLQLFTLTVLLLTLAPDARHRALVLGVAAASLFFFNLDSDWDVTALYFYGSYGLGLMAWWAARSARPLPWLALLAALGVAALALEFRGRLLLAVGVAFALVAFQRHPGWGARWQGPWVAWLSRVSYSLFLIHFPVCLLVSALVHHAWPGELLPNALGMVAAFGLSLLAGAALYRWVEAPAAPWRSWAGGWAERPTVT